MKNWKTKIILLFGIYYINFSNVNAISTCVINDNQIDSLNSSQLKDESVYFNYQQVNGIKGFYVGYWYNPKEKNKKMRTGHIIDIGFTKELPSAALGYSYYVGNHFYFNSKLFCVAPKIGGSINFLIATLGSDLALYTDFENNSTYIMPYFGVGIGVAKIAMSLNLPLYNKKFIDNGFASIGVTVPLNLWKRNKAYSIK